MIIIQNDPRMPLEKEKQSAMRKCRENKEIKN